MRSESLNIENLDSPGLRQVIAKAVGGLRVATGAHDAMWRLGQSDWNVDQDAKVIIFTTPNGIKIVAPVQIIGTYNLMGGTWLWAWDNPSILPPLAENARRIKNYGLEHNYAQLVSRKLQCTKEECWEFTALAYLLCEANGAYRGQDNHTFIFMTFGEVRLSKA